MRKISIDDNIYQHLLQNAQEVGENASSILRRLLGLRGGRATPSLASADGTCVTSAPPANPALRDNAVNDLASRIDLAYARTAVDRFLVILAALHQVRGNAFHRLLTLGDRKRSYFGNSQREIESTGSHTYPKQIPNSDYWVVTNNDTPKKQSMVQEAMEELGYSPAAAEAIAALVDPKAMIPQHWPHNGSVGDADDDGKLRI